MWEYLIFCNAKRGERVGPLDLKIIKHIFLFAPCKKCAGGVYDDSPFGMPTPPALLTGLFYLIF